MTNPTLNDEQKTAVEHGKGPLLIIAGAGTGKTTVITERIKHLILTEKVSPKNILALTFTEKASTEMQERIDIALPYGYSDMWIHTFHGFCDRILRKEAIHIGLTPAYKMFTETQSLLFLKKHLFELKLSYFLPLGNPDKFLSGLLQHFSRLKDEDISPEEYLDYAKKLQKKQDILQEEKDIARELANAYQTYEEIKKKEGIMDFSDLIANTLYLFRKRKNILKKYQDQFQFILVDEFQDTNYSQNQLAILLAGERKNISVVGDDDQSIYRWRGAAISNMMQFKKNFPKTTVVTLGTNYRSTQHILDTAYKVIQNNNPDRLEVKEKINKHLTAFRKEKGEEVALLLGKNGEEEAEKVSETIKRLLNAKNYSYKDFAILVRANDHAQPFMRALDRHSMPYQFLGPEQLFLREEIKDLIAILKVLYNIRDDQSLFRVLCIPALSLPINDIPILLQTSRKQNKDLIEIVDNIDTTPITEKGKESVKTISLLIKKLRENIMRETAGKLLYDFFAESGMMQKLLTEQSHENDLRAQNIAKFFDKLKSFESQSADASIFAAVDWIDLSTQMGESPLATENDWSTNDAVNILTIHSSKGLEFPVVFVVNLVTQRFPSRERGEQIPIPDTIVKELLPTGDVHLQEERRLFYVATTRAKDILFLTAAFNYSENKRERKISPFLMEAIGEETVIKEREALQTQVHTMQLPTHEEKQKMKQVKTKITYLSYSQIQTFDICPLHYKLRYILKLPTEPSSALSYGNSVHALLREYYLRATQGEKPQLSDIPNLLREFWIPEGYDSKIHQEQAFQSAVNITESYIKKNFDEKNLPLGLEVPFLFSLGKLKIGGRIDRIDKSTNGIQIIDYKTGRNMLSERELKNNLQLTIYALAANRIREPLFAKAPSEIELALHYLESGKIMPTTRTQEQLNEAEIALLSKAEEIENSDFSCSKSMFCEHCEYATFCSTLR